MGKNSCVFKASQDGSSIHFSLLRSLKAFLLFLCLSQSGPWSLASGQYRESTQPPWGQRNCWSSAPSEWFPLPESSVPLVPVASRAFQCLWNMMFALYLAFPSAVNQSIDLLWPITLALQMTLWKCIVIEGNIVTYTSYSFWVKWSC